MTDLAKHFTSSLMHHGPAQYQPNASVNLVPWQIFPAETAIDFPFTDLPDPTNIENAPTSSHRFLFDGFQLNPDLLPRSVST